MSVKPDPSGVRKYWIGDIVFHGDDLVEVAANSDGSGIILCRRGTEAVEEIPDHELRVPTDDEAKAIWAYMLRAKTD